MLKNMNKLQLTLVCCMIALAGLVGLGAVSIPAGLLLGFAGAVTFDLATKSGVATLAGQNRQFVIEDFIDVPDGAVSTDILQSLNIPAGTYVRNVFVEIIEACVATSITATVGDGAGANSWDASTNLAAVAGTITGGAGGTDTYVTTGKLYTAADTIDLVVTVNTMTAGGRYKITADCLRVKA